MTVVIYGDVEIHNVVTRQWSQTIEYDPSQTDALFTRFSLRFEGIIHAQKPAGSYSITTVPAWTYPRGIAGVLGGAALSTATDIYKAIISTLSRPRLPLLVTVGSGSIPKTLLEVYPTLQQTLTIPDRDVDNGPKPKLFSIEHIAGDRCYRISWGVECAKVLCLQSAGVSTVPFVLNNRWSIDEDMDGDCRITRTINGDLRLSAPVSLLGNDFKGIVVPGLEDGFKRRNIRFSTDKTGLAANYTIIDQQVKVAAPWPCTSISATHTESTNDGVSMFSDMRVRVVGRPDADPRLLLTRAIQIMDARLKFLNMKDKDGKTLPLLVDSAGIVEHIGEENVVESYLRLRVTQKDELPVYFSNLLGSTFGTPLRLDDLKNQPAPYDPVKSPIPTLYGYNVQQGERRPSVLLLLQCYLQQPCEEPHGIAKFTTSPNKPGDDDESKKGYTPIYTGDQPSPGDKPNPPDTGLSESAKATVYTMSRMETVYATHAGMVQLPIASRVDTPAAGSPTSAALATMADTTAAAASPNDEDTCIFIQLSRGACRRTIELDAERVGQWPEIIAPVESYVDGTLKGRLLKHTITPLPPSLSADMTQKIFRIHASYLYGLNRPPKLTEKFAVGVLPFTKYTMEETKFDPVAYTPRLGPGDVTSQNTPSV